jgi:AcrR family transcriptional regulator
MSSNKNNSTSPLRLSPQPVLKIEKSERTRTEIINSALDFIWVHPFRDMTVNSLMASTSTGRSAFYRYFKDLHDLMESLLEMLKDEVYTVAGPWYEGTGDPIVLLNESLVGLVDVCYNLGPILKAANDAAATDEKYEKVWKQFIEQFDDVVATRIEADQKQDLIPDFDARPVAEVLNRLDVLTLLDAFGQHPRKQPKPVYEALARIWISTLYGSEWLGKRSSDLVRT